VQAALSAETVRPLTDLVTLHPAEVRHYSIEADLYFYAGPDIAVVAELARKNVWDYVRKYHLLGHDITTSGIHQSLHQHGVQRVEIKSPAELTGSSGMIIGSREAAFCDSIILSIKGTDK
jgi:phage-related baseplate assembly protein